MINSPKVTDATDLSKPLFTYTAIEVKQMLSQWASSFLPAALAPAEQESSVPEFLTKEEARAYLGKISMVTLDKLVRERKLIPCRPTPDRIVFSREDLRNYLLLTKNSPTK